MGQRTCILLKKNYGNNRSTITLIHHQWGIGKVMPALLVQEVLKSAYPLNRSLEYFYGSRLKEENKLPIDYFYTFEPLSNPQNNYITNKEVATDDLNEDIWKPEVRIRYGNMTDNNNGMMLVEVTQNYEDNGDVQSYGHVVSAKIGFALGSEEVYYYHEHLRDSIQIEPEFDRLVSMEEFALRTFDRGDESNKFTKKFINACRVMFELEGVQEVYDKQGKSKRDKKEKHIDRCIEALTKDLLKSALIDVPMEFKEVHSLYE